MAEINTPRYFGEPFNHTKVEQKDYIDIVNPFHDGSDVVKTDFSRYNGKVSQRLNSHFGDPATEAELIQTYRSVSEHQDVEFAIDEIVNEIIVTDGESQPIEVNLDSIEEFTEETKEEIREEFENILSMLNFARDGFEIFKRYYVDSRLHFYKVVDPNNLSDGIKELRYLDPISIRKVKEVVTQKKHNSENQSIDSILDTKEYYIYTPNANAYANKECGFGFLTTDSKNALSSMFSTNESYVLNAYAVASVDSGLFDYNRNCVKGYLHKTIKPLNDLVNLETHMIIYRVARAPERRVFYIDTGTLPPNKAQQYINLVQDSYRREVNYDASTGQIRSDTKTLSMHEDFWLPRSSSGKGTEVDTLSGAQNLSQIEDIEYMDKKFKNSLSVPISRFDRENSASIIFGANQELSRDEVKFQKFVGRLRSRFSSIFRDILGTQLILKGVVEPEVWYENENRIVFDYVKDTYIEDSRKYAIWERKMEILKNLDEVEGKYVTREFIWKEILDFTDEEIQQTKEKLKQEKAEFGAEDGDMF